jgi:hypothetical protein
MAAWVMLTETDCSMFSANISPGDGGAAPVASDALEHNRGGDCDRALPDRGEFTAGQAFNRARKGLATAMIRSRTSRHPTPGN